MPPFPPGFPFYLDFSSGTSAIATALRGVGRADVGPVLHPCLTFWPWTRPQDRLLNITRNPSMTSWARDKHELRLGGVQTCVVLI